MAPNISLQNLVRSAHEKKEGYAEKLQERKKQMDREELEPKIIPARKADEDAEKFVNDFRMLSIKAKVMEDEYQETAVLVDTNSENVRTKEISLHRLQTEKQDCIERLKKVQKELELISKFEEQED